MTRGKLLTIEGTDCSGKETQSKLLCEKLNNIGIKTIRLSYPMYDTPTGKIIGGPYLGKENIGDPLFEEGAGNVSYKVASCYFAADRKYNEKYIEENLNNGVNIILDRYIESNMAHQGGKILDINERHEAYQFIYDLEYGLMKLRKPDKTFFLYMPYEYSLELRKGRNESPDQHELDKNHLLNAEKAYFELASLYDFQKIDCTNEKGLRSVESINDELFEEVKKLF